MNPMTPSICPARTVLIVCVPLILFASCNRSETESSAAAGAPPVVAKASTKPGVKTTVHRKDAGEPDGTGWCLARSTEGRFTVQLPTSFNDFTVTMPAEEGVTVMADSIGANTEHETHFTAVRTRRSDGKILISSLDEIADRLRKEGRLKEQKPVLVLGNPALEIRTEEGDRIGVLRTLKVEGTLYQLGVEYSRKTAPATIDNDISKFFDSFRLLAETEE